MSFLGEFKWPLSLCETENNACAKLWSDQERVCNTPYAEREETGSDKRKKEASWALFARVRNMAAHGSVSSRLSQSFTEEDIPGASLQGRNPTALKSDELRFWLKCRGDPAKGLKTKAQLAKRQVQYLSVVRDTF